MTDLQRQFYDMLMRSQYWSTERMQEHQRSQLTQLLLHARRTVPFYEHRLDTMFRPDGTIDWDRWTEIPILTRADLRNSFAEMQASELPPGHGRRLITRSSGSTGQPTATAKSSLALMAGDAALARSFAWHDIDTTKRMVRLYGDTPGIAPWPDGRTSGWGPRFLLEQRDTCLELDLFSSVEQQLDFVHRFTPAYLSGLVTRLEAVALAARQQRLAINLEAILPFGESVSPRFRALMREVFDARVVEMYSSEETDKIAHQCPDEPCLHINSELMIVEVVDAGGLPVARGERGEVVITPFYNTAQPLIRYRIGDLAVAAGPCACGRHLPAIPRIEGRVFHLFRTPDGRMILPNVPDDAVARMGITQWQLAQTTPTTAEFRYVAAVPGSSPPADDLLTVLMGGIESELDIELRPMDAFPPASKHISYRNELSRD